MRDSLVVVHYEDYYFSKIHRLLVHGSSGVLELLPLEPAGDLGVGVEGLSLQTVNSLKNVFPMASCAVFGNPFKAEEKRSAAVR